MTKEREALKLALEYVELVPDDRYNAEHIDREALVTAIKEALAEPWEKFCDSNCVWTDHHPDCKLAEQEKTVCPFCSSEWVTAEQHDRKMDRLEYQSTADKSKLEKVPAKGALLAQPAVTESHKRPSRSDIKPLSDDEIILIVAECASSHQHTDIHFARAIEAAVWEKQK